MFKQRTLFMIISLIWSVHQWTRLCPRLLSTSWNKTDKMIWIFHGYIQIDIRICITHTQRISITRHLVIYLWWWLYVCHPISKGQSVTTVYKCKKHTVGTWNDQKNTSITFPHTERKQEEFISFGFHFGSMKDWASVYLRILTLTLL